MSAQPIPRRKRLKRWLGIAALVLALAVVVVVLTLTLTVRGSLPQMAGTVELAGLTADTQVRFDARGIPSIDARSFEDVARVQGFLHAQQRFFQMDLTRRAAAGELSALFGDMTVSADRRLRVPQHRQRARGVMARIPADQRRWLEAYTVGVNEGLQRLGARPPEYLLLNSKPEPWRVEDSVLVFYFFFIGLSDNHSFERPLGPMRAALPPEVFEFLTPRTSRLDAPMGAPPDDPTGGYAPADIPPPSVLDLRELSLSESDHRIVRTPVRPRGSNNWAVAGSRTVHGGALVANDTHLAIRVPNTYFRNELRWTEGGPGGGGPPVADGGWVRGVSIPGQPGVIVGSTDHLAWGPTAGVLDQTDLVVVEEVEGGYRVGDTVEPFVVENETIEIRGAEPVQIEVRKTRWGPVVGEDFLSRPLALRSTGLDPGGINFEIYRMMRARTLEQAIEIFSAWNGPALNWVLASETGRIGWVVNGVLPERRGFDGSVPESWADGTKGWVGEVPGPRILDPEDGFLWTANNRTVPIDAAGELSQFWIFPQRAQRIRDRLQGRNALDERALLELQLDTSAHALEPLRAWILEALAADARDERVAAFRRGVEGWNGTADADQSGFRLVHAFYMNVYPLALSGMLQPVAELDSGFVYNWSMGREVLLRLMEERPSHLLPANFDTWNDLAREAVARSIAGIEASSHGLDAPWGQVNSAKIQHSLGGLPVIGPWWNMPEDPLPGWEASVRAQSPSYGATLRMVVGPAHQASALFHMPGGQSGHPLSRHYDDGHADWVEGRATPFLAGEAVSQLSFVPQR